MKFGEFKIRYRLDAQPSDYPWKYEKKYFASVTLEPASPVKVFCLPFFETEFEAESDENALRTLTTQLTEYFEGLQNEDASR